MSCYHPIYAYKTGRLTKNGKDEIKFCASNPHTRFGDEKFLREYYGDKLVPLPCGKCIGCHLDRSKDWAVRCVLESLSHSANCFITLTYDEVNCPKRLVKKHLQDFLKRLRARHSDLTIKFFACGEYGSLNKRPHYHAIIFGYDFTDKQYLMNDGISHIFTSNELEQLWPFGISSIGEVSIESCAYVARYSMKKVNDAVGDEFLLMSRRPGLASSWFLENKDIVYLTDKIYGSFGSSHTARPPRYFDKLAEDNGVDLTTVKQERIKRAQAVNELAMYLHGLGRYESLNKLNEVVIAGRVQSLVRYL